METILKKKILTTTETNVEIKLPYYCANICFAYKIISETEALQLIFTSFDTGIQKTKYFDSVFNPKNEFVEITSEEFESKYNEIKEELLWL